MTTPEPSPPALRAVAEVPPFTFSAAEAARECGVSKKAIQRKMPQLEELGAMKDEQGFWRITPQQLRSAGFHPGVSRPDPAPKAAPSRDVSPVPEPVTIPVMVPVTELHAARAKLYELEAELLEVREDRDHYRTQLAVAEALANERLPMSEVLRIIAVTQPRAWWQRRPKQITAGPQS